MEGTNPLTMSLPLHLTCSSEWPTLTSDMEGTKSFSHEHNGSALTSNQVGTHPSITSKWLHIPALNDPGN